MKETKCGFHILTVTQKKRKKIIIGTQSGTWSQREKRQNMTRTHNLLLGRLSCCSLHHCDSSNYIHIFTPCACARGTVVVVFVCLCVCVSVCVSVTALAATYLVCKSGIRCYKVPSGVSNVYNVWIFWKRFVLQFWRHLPTATFHAFWQDLNGEDEQQWAPFKIQSVYFQR